MQSIERGYYQWCNCTLTEFDTLIQKLLGVICVIVVYVIEAQALF